MSTFRIHFYRPGPLFGGAMSTMGDRFNRHQLREALDQFRFYAHSVTWDVVWVLKRGNKTIAKLTPPADH